MPPGRGLLRGRKPIPKRYGALDNEPGRLLRQPKHEQLRCDRGPVGRDGLRQVDEHKEGAWVGQVVISPPWHSREERQNTSWCAECSGSIPIKGATPRQPKGVA